MLILRIARENAQWGYRRVVGELRKLRLSVSKSTVSRVLKNEGIYSPPGNGRIQSGETAWRRSIYLHMNTLVAFDSFTKAIMTPLGIRTAYCLFCINPESRKVFLAPATFHADASWMLLQAHSFAKWCEDQCIQVKYLIHDRDKRFAISFDALFSRRGVRMIRTPVQAPNANAFAESWVATVKREFLDHFVCFSLAHLNHVAQEYTHFHNQDRPYQGVGNRPLTFQPRIASDGDTKGAIHCREYLGGLLKEYHREAA